MDKPWKIKSGFDLLAECTSEAEAQVAARNLSDQGFEDVEIWLQPKPSTQVRWNALARAELLVAMGIGEALEA